MSLNQTDPVVIVSADSHVGPRLREDLRDYCPKEYLDDFDRMVEDVGPIVNGQALMNHPNAGPGHHEPTARLADMDSDGVAAEVIYHGSQNGEPLPWTGAARFGLSSFDVYDERMVKFAELGCDIYDRWLADFCSADPQRLLGLVHIPAWNIEKSVEVVKWAAKAGLTGVNFPVCGRRGVKAYNNPAWDPFWKVCVDNGITLHTHGNGAPVHDENTEGPGSQEITITDVGSWSSRRSAHFLIYGQVFDRFPDLRLVITEIEEQWYQTTQWALDSQYRRFGHVPLKKGLPSAYFPTNIYMGASFMSAQQAVEASRAGYADNVLWGRDYPHMEGAHQAGDFAEAVHLTALRNVMSRVPQDDAVKMAGLNGVRALGLDGEYLAEVAGRIAAPTVERLTTPVDSFPDILPLCMAFAGQSGPRPLELEEMDHFTLTPL